MNFEDSEIIKTNNYEENDNIISTSENNISIDNLI